MNDSLPALHRALVEALLQRQHHAAHQPVTVAEIYQDLIPYRTVRTSIGFALNADYEHALLKLLAGDGGYARIEPAEVQNELRHELKSSNPNVGVFRNFAACDVFVTLPQDFERHRQAGSKHAQQPSAAPVQPAPPANNMPGERAVPTVAQARPGNAAAAAPSVVRAANGAVSCTACRKGLPTSGARFCPFCGHDQSRRLCARCREPLDAAWKFCAACGTPA
jgi:hypothetical protein